MFNVVALLVILELPFSRIDSNVQSWLKHEAMGPQPLAINVFSFCNFWS